MIDLLIYVVDSVVNIRVWIEFVNILSIIIGSGINSGINRYNIDIIILLVIMFLKRWKFSDSGFEKFFRILIGKKSGVGEMYFVKNLSFFFLKFV